MKRLALLRAVLRHTFSKKALSYRAVAFSYVFTITWIFTGSPFKGLELTFAIVGGKMILYGIVEAWHLRHVSMDDGWEPEGL